ncbi:hypothetical protein AB1K32_26275 [Metabacillus dongyingensis]
MSRESKSTLSEFVNNDRFELNSYLTYLFLQLNNKDLNQSEDSKEGTY